MDWINPNVISVAVGLVALATTLILVGKWIGRREEFEQNANETFSSISKDINGIRNDIKNIFIEMPRRVSVQESPLRLTDFGQSISDRLEAQQWAEKTAKMISNEVDGFSAYAIQEWAYRFIKVDERFPSEDMTEEKMELAAFNYGTGVHDVLEVLAIELRDELLKLHGLEVSA